MLDLEKINSLLRSINEDNSEDTLPSVKDIPKKELIKAAQKEYDEWDPSGEDGDPELGFGGICQEIAEAMAGVLSEKGIDAATVSAQIGDQHVWVVAKFKEGVYNIDIDPRTYERGSGYSWSKTPKVIFREIDLDIHRIDPDPEKFDQYAES